MQLFYLFLTTFTLQASAFDQTFRSEWRMEKFCYIYDYDMKTCHPCDQRRCKPPKIKANVNCKIFTCVSDTTPSVSKSTTTPTPTTKSTTTTIYPTTIPTTTITTTTTPTPTTSTSQPSTTTTTSTENLCIMAT